MEARVMGGRGGGDRELGLVALGPRKAAACHRRR